MKLVIIDNYDSFTFNLYQMVCEFARQIHVFRNDCVTFEQIKTLQPTHIILSPGPGHPANSKDFGICAEIIARQDELTGVRILGVCLGHQGIVHYLGGEVGRAPQPVHGKKSLVRKVAESPLFSGLPEQFSVMRYHSLVANAISVPECLMVTATTTDDLVMSVRHRSKPLYGVQFHPESIGTECGCQIMENFLTLC